MNIPMAYANNSNSSVDDYVYRSNDFNEVKNFSAIENSQAVQDLLINLNKQIDFSDIQTLKDYDNTDRYYYLPFLTAGYLIYDKELDIVQEYSENRNNSYIENNTNLYYTGALGYYQKQDNNFIQITTGESVGNEEDFEALAIEQKKNMKQKLSSSNSRLSMPNSRMSIMGVVPNYEYNPDGICGSTSAGMILRWYDIYVNDRYVPTSLESSDGVKLIQRLRTYIDDKSSARSSLPGDMYTGIISYCSDQGVNHDGGFSLASVDSIVGRISSYQRPFIITVHNHPKYGNHAMAAYGYNTVNGTFYVTVNDGWGDTGISINMVNVQYMIW